MQDRKKELKKKQVGDHALLKKTGLDIDLVNEHEEDIKLAKLLTHKKGIYLSKLKYPFLSYTLYFHERFLFRCKEKRKYRIKTASFDCTI